MGHRRARVSRAISLGAVAVLSGCAGNVTRAPAPSFDGSVSEDVLLVVIDNQQLDDARVTIWLGGTRRRLGTVRANSREEYRVNLGTMVNVYLEFDLTLGARCVTDTLPLGPGDNVQLIIPPNLSLMRARCTRE